MKVRLVGCLAVALTVGLAASARAGDDAAVVRLKIFLKVATYDGRFPGDARTLKLGLLFPAAGNREPGLAATRAAVVSLSSLRVRGLDFQVIELPYSDLSHMEADLTNAGVYGVVIAEATSHADVEVLSDILVRLHLMSFAEDPGALDHGAAAAVEIIDNRPRIVVNTVATQACGHELASSLLALARLLK